MLSKKFLTATLLLVPAALAPASNHREAPITALDQKADITDIYAFVSYAPDQPSPAPPQRVTLMMCVDPLLEPGNGPTIFPFDPAILYEIHVDNDHDALPDLTFQYRFDTQFRLPHVYTAVAGVGPNGANAPGTNTLVVPPRITDFSNPGLNLVQTYSLKMVDVATGTVTPLTNPGGAPLYAVPCNAGPRTMDYEALYQQGTYSLPNGMKTFAGTTDDAFWIDLGATFDTANFRFLSSGVPGVLTAAEDAQKDNLASDTVSGFAVNTIAIEMPIPMLTSTGAFESPTSPAATIGVWCTTSRQQFTIRSAPNPHQEIGQWSQIQRMGHPLINELVIGIGQKDFYSMSKPAQDQQFTQFFLDPPIVHIIEALYGGALKVPSAPRLDLLPLVTYAPPIAATGTPPGPVADLLRLNVGVGPSNYYTNASRLGLLGGDPAGYPNGRRLFDDVTDIVLRVAIGGVLAAPFAGYDPNVNARLGDGVNRDDRRYHAKFPYIGSCPSGRNRRHVDPGELKGGPVH